MSPADGGVGSGSIRRHAISGRRPGHASYDGDTESHVHEPRRPEPDLRLEGDDRTAVVRGPRRRRYPVRLWPERRHGCKARRPVVEAQHQFVARVSARGNATIERFAVDNEGYKSTTQFATVFVNSPPRVTYTVAYQGRPSGGPNTPAVGQEITFTSTATDDGDPLDPQRGVKLVEWDFEFTGVFAADATGPSVTHSFPDSTDRTVALQVTDNRDSKRRQRQLILVGGADPVASAATGGPATQPPVAAVTPAATTPVAPGRASTRPSRTTAPRAACANVIRGSARNDRLSGTSGGDRILGLGGGDVLSGASGDDCLLGGAGDDKLSGGSGRDTLTGGAGKDRLTGGPGDDRLTGAAGADILAGGAGTNRYSAGGGDDTVNSANGKRETVSCGGGRDVVRADAADRLRGCERIIRA
ncbi:MAG: PKD domain-containing protein [Thermoleophilaceae bacterium]